MLLRETYPGTATLREARARYFEILGVDDGGYSARWVKLRAGPLRFAFPNTTGRMRAVRFHDLHHVLTGYRPTWRGECEIASWELASGMASFWTGFAINAGAFLLGLVLCPVRSFRAWVRGRRSSNGYRGIRNWTDAILDERVDDVRARLSIAGDDTRATFRDAITYAALVLLLLAPSIVVAAIVIAFLTA